MKEIAARILGGLPITDGVFTIALVLVVLLYVYNQVRKITTMPKPRPIAGFERIKLLVDAARESGRPIHISLGLGAINTSGVVDSTVGLSVLNYINTHLAGIHLNCEATCGDATLASSALGIESDNDFHASGGCCYEDRTYYCGSDPLLYANGVAQHLNWQPPAANLLVGLNGAECLFITESPASSHTQQCGGASCRLAAALLYVATGDALVGEEYYAAGAYFHHPEAVRSLITQDWLRYIITLAVIAGIIAASLG